ncbi:MAG: N-acetyl-gamma-glutamyl-phosphate reductase [Clostridia bacterium]|nr:N-acetyl-gamma-glutamyl-phosphate reductase [Clostridia bacterium]
MIRVGVVGATGYVGMELLRLLAGHPEARVTAVVSSSAEGKLADMWPQFAGYFPLDMSGFSAEELAEKCDVVFTALPHGAAGPAIRALHEKGICVIDMSAELRYSDPVVYKEWYGADNAVADLLPGAVYGLCELYREKIKGNNLIGNPGCYTTSAILALYPLLESGLIEKSGIVIDAKSGVSGAGKNATATTHFCESAGSFKAYGIGTHRHTSEIEQELSLAACDTVNVSFTPHLLPVKRGILSTIYATPKPGVTASKINDCYSNAYRHEPFVQLMDAPPELKHVVGSNRVAIGFVHDQRVNRIIIISCLDNLIKGAAGQAVQNMNIRFGIKETAGLDAPAWYL